MSKKGLSDPYQLLYAIVKRLSFLIKDDKTFVRLIYYCRLHKRLNLKNPSTYNEKLQWLKLYDKRPEYTKLVDKYKVKDHVAHIIGKEHIIPTIGVWERAEDIDFNQLPNQFVLKTTHDSGGLYICKDKSQMNENEIRAKMAKSLKRNYFRIHREYPYKNVKRRVIAEPFMIDDSGKGLKDYKFFCFDGVPKMMFVATDRPIDTRFDFFDMDFNHLPIRQGHPQATKPIEKPKGFAEMKKLASILSQGFPHVRIDFYDINGQIYFGEYTFFHYSGLVPFHPEEWDTILGSWLQLPLNQE
ncbi:MAG: glycosyl transferase [Prevotella sp.]|nr:glycosyl transferase [Prevotella sp.]